MDLVVVPDDVVEGEADDAADRLCVEQQQPGGDPTAQWSVRVGEDLPEQLDAASASDGRGLADLRRRQCEPAGELHVRAPQQESASGDALMLLVLDVPGIDLSLSAVRQDQLAFTGPTKERRGVADPVSGEPAPGRGDGLALRVGAELGQDVPGGEPPDDLLVLGIGDAREVFAEPPLEKAELLVHQREQTAGHEQFPQMGGGGPPWLELVERVVGEFNVAVSRVLPPLRGSWTVRGSSSGRMRPVLSSSRAVSRPDRVQRVQSRRACS
ncbi:hypothetical protein AB0425_31620 [Actinosynnema sp. NPDC051121]|nr:hypothetical protein [Saccharothrix sp.]